LGQLKPFEAIGWLLLAVPGLLRAVSVPFRVVLGHFGRFKAILGYFEAVGSTGVLSGHFEPL
jgi:hypothetical protein